MNDSSVLARTIGAHSFQQMETIPAFLGYTEHSGSSTRPLLHTPTRISSLAEYEGLLGGRFVPEEWTVRLKPDGTIGSVATGKQLFLHDSVRLFFENGGRECVVVSLGTFDQPVSPDDFRKGLEALRNEETIRLIIAPDLVALNDGPRNSIAQQMLREASEAGDRFVLLDLPQPIPPFSDNDFTDAVSRFRTGLGTSYLSFGAAYAPFVVSSFIPEVEDEVVVVRSGRQRIRLSDLITGSPRYRQVREAVDRSAASVPPSGAIAGIIATVDREQGIHKPPANVSLSGVEELSYAINDQTQEDLNVDAVSGKSINAIRLFQGRGILIWGARTLAGNDNEWRYLSTRRYAQYLQNTIEENLKWVVFEPNADPLWSRIKTDVGNLLQSEWRQGALQGQKQSEAFFINVGLGETMTANDIDGNRLIIYVGFAPLKPAEFIILQIAFDMSP